MPRQLVILKVLFWVFGFLLCVAGAVLTFRYAGSLGDGPGLFGILGVLRLLARILVGALGLLLLVTALTIGSKKVWVWELALTSSALCIGSIILAPLGIYGMRVLMRRQIANYYGRYSHF